MGAVRARQTGHRERESAVAAFHSVAESGQPEGVRHREHAQKLVLPIRRQAGERAERVGSRGQDSAGADPGQLRRDEGRVHWVATGNQQQLLEVAQEELQKP